MKMRIAIAVSICLIFHCALDAQTWISTDKTCYGPGSVVSIAVSRKVPAGTRVRYNHLGQVIKDTLFYSALWQWQPPASDFKGYLIELYLPGKDRKDSVIASIAVDVSSDWARFPRYGFLSWYSRFSNEQIHRTIEKLNRFHINGLQFYDWQYKHHQPLGVSGSAPLEHWKDIGDRENYFSTVKRFIQEAHTHGMKAMSYNLIYGALEGAKETGVKDEWYLYQDTLHESKEIFKLPEPFISPIYLMDPSSTGWQDFINTQDRKLYQALDFDGYHIDQLGNRDKPLYNYDGKPVDLPSTFRPFIEAVKKAEPSRSIVMNSVNQYGQPGIAQSPATFLYTEIWPPNESFADMVHIILQNDSLGKGKKGTVLAAYMNYRIADHKGFFNTPSILLADAVIFAFGGAHLELGDHMLDKEYFPQDSLKMKPGLNAPLLGYYDFEVAYQNILRDDQSSFISTGLRSADGKHAINDWPPQNGAVSAFAKRGKHYTVLHLINFSTASTLEWQDKNGVQTAPVPIKNMALALEGSPDTKKIWYSSPDLNHGVPASLPFFKKGDTVYFTVPVLKYWDMIVLE